MKRLAILLMTLVLASCAGTDNVAPPTALEPVDETLQTKRLWAHDTGNGEGGFFLRLQPYVEDGKIFVVSRAGEFTAWNSAGKSLWKTALQPGITAGVNGGEGIVAAGNENREVIAVSADDGKELWRQSVSSLVTALSRVEDGVLVARSGDGNIFGLDAHSGDVRWKISRTVPALSIHGQSEPLVTQGVALVGLDNGRLLLASLKDGQVAWEKVVAIAEGRSEIERMVDIDGALALRGAVVFVVTYHGKIAAIDARSGKTVWMRDASSVTGVSEANGRVVFSDENSVVWSLDARTGVPIWKQEALKFRRLTRPVAVGDYLVVGDFEGYLHWLDAATGKLVARDRASSHAILAAPVVADGKVHVLATDGKLSVWVVDSGK